MILTTHDIIEAYWQDNIPVNGIIKWYDHHCLFKLNPDNDDGTRKYYYDIYHSGFGRRVKSELFRKWYQWDITPICGRFSIEPSNIINPNGVRPLNFKIEEDVDHATSCPYGHSYLLWDGKFFGHDFKTLKEAAKFAFKRITTEGSFDPKQDFDCFYCFQTVGLYCEYNKKLLGYGYELRNGCLVQNTTVHFYHYLNQLRSKYSV